MLYVLSASGNAAGTIEKYSLVSGSWTANGSYATLFGGFGLAAAQQGTGATLFVTTGQGALVANNVLKVTDDAGYNATINVTTANNVTLYTTPAGTILKGIDFVPTAAAVTDAGAGDAGDGGVTPPASAVPGSTDTSLWIGGVFLLGFGILLIGAARKNRFDSV